MVITGASSGLGHGMAHELAARGHNLALCARRADRLDRLREELRSAYPGVQAVTRTLDVTDHAQVFETFRAFRDDLGALDRVIVNAGIGHGRRIGTGGFAANARTAQTSFVGALAQCEAAMEIFRDQGDGHLVVVASVSAVRGLPGSATTYAATKAGMASLAEGIRADTAGSPIRVTTLFPGFIPTELTERRTRAPFMVEVDDGCRALAATEREPA